MMNWEAVKRDIQLQVDTILVVDGWEPLADDIYTKDGSRVRCYLKALEVYGWLSGYWIKVEAPVVGGVKRWFLPMVIVDDVPIPPHVVVDVDSDKLLAKIAEVME